MIGPEVLEWIQQQKAAGQTKSDIYLHLFQQGYQPQEINPALKEAFAGETPWWQKNIFLILTVLLLIASAVMFVYFLMSG